MCVSVLIAVMSESISTHLGLRFCYPWIQKLMPAAGYWTPAKSSLWEGHLSGLLKRYAFHCCSYDIINKIRHYRNETVISYILCKHFFFWMGDGYLFWETLQKPFKNNQILLFPHLPPHFHNIGILNVT